MRLPGPVYYSCLISLLMTGTVRTAAQPPPPSSAPAAERESRGTRHFQIPAADAGDSLKAFTRQAGTALVYVVEQVRGVRTNGIEGRFPPREALERLVANTALLVVEDARTGALMIKRQPPSPSSALSAFPSEPNPNLQPMKLSLAKPRTGWLPALLVVLTATANSQTVTNPPPGATEAKSEEVLVLSPFTVQTDKDTGYQATSTLAGSRLNTPIKDIGASISVYTKDFLNDIGATNANELLIYATGSEAAGPGGNFSNAAGANIGLTQVVGDGIRNDPQGGSRVRGLSSPTFTRGFFISDVGIDGYNTSAITVNRGPNAILFGVSSPAGVVDTTLLQTDLLRNLNKFEFRYGDNDSMRASLDINRVLIPKKLGFRVAALQDNERFNQRPAFENKQRLYGAVTFAPFQSTILRGSFETGHTKANRPFSVLPFKSVSPQWLATRQAFDWKFFDDPVRNPILKDSAGVDIAGTGAAAQSAGGTILNTTPPQFHRGYLISSVQIFDSFAFPVADPTVNGGGAVSVGFRAFPSSSPSTGPGALTRNTIRRDVFDPVFNRDSADDGAFFFETRNIFELQPAFYSTPDRIAGRFPAGIKMQGFTDYSAFDWRNKQIDETGRQGDSFSTYTLSLEQRAWKDRLGIELAYFAERYSSRNENKFLSTQGNANHIRIDPNLFLPDGRPNPNVGRPYVNSASTGFGNLHRQREALRATPYLRYDFKDLSPTWGKWLGKHTLTGLAERTSRDDLNVGSRFAYFGQYDDFSSSNPYSFNRFVNLLGYVGPSIIGNNNPIKLVPISVAPIRDGSVISSTFWEAAAGDPNQAKLITIPYTVRKIFTGGNYSREILRSRAANLMSYWFDDLLVTNVGWRRDEDYFFRESFENNTANLFRPERGFGSIVLPGSPPLVAAKEIKSYSAVLRWPQKLLRLPKNMDLSVFMNVSENFSPNASRVDPYGNLLPSPTGETKESGFNFSFLDNRFNIRVNQYETKVKNADIGRPTAMGEMVNRVILQTTAAWVTQVNSHPNASRQADIDLLYSPLPANWKALYKVGLSGSADTQNLTQVDTQIAGYGDTSDYVAKGTEIDIVYNPTRNWRILVNVAKNQTVQSNIAPGTREIVNRFRPVLAQLANRPKAVAPANYVFPVDANGKITSFDEGMGFGTLGQFVAQQVDVPLANLLAAEGVSSPEIRKYRANFVTNYTFDRDGLLKGFGVGSGVRWQDKVGIGYPVSYTAAGTVFIDRAHPYFAPGDTNVDAWVSYSRKLWNNRIDWKVQLNVRNVIGDKDTIAITAQPDGSPASVRLPPDRRWYITNTFSF